MDRRTETIIDQPNDQDLLLSASLQDGPEPPEQLEPQLIRVSRLLWRDRSLVGKATLAGFFVALMIALLMPNTYEATVQLMPPDSTSLSGMSTMLGLVGTLGGAGLGGSSGGSSAGGLAGTVGDLLGAQRPGPLFIGILSSRTLCDRMIDRFDLRRVYWFRTYARTRKKLLSRVTFVEDKKSGLIRITVKDRDRDRATAMARAYIEELNNLLSQVNNSSASREREFLEKRLASIHGELDSAAKDLSEFSSRNATLDPEDQGKAMIEAAAMLQGQLIAAKSELSALQQIYAPENVRVRSLQAHVQELELQLNKFGGKGYTGAASLDANSLYPSIRQLPVLGRQYAELYRRAKVDETVFELLTQAYEMAKVQEAKDTPSVKVLDAPRLPERSSNFPVPVVACFGAFLSFIAVGCWIVWMEQWPDNDPYRVLLADIREGARRRWEAVRATRMIGSETENGSHR